MTIKENKQKSNKSAEIETINIEKTLEPAGYTFDHIKRRNIIMKTKQERKEE